MPGKEQETVKVQPPEPTAPPEPGGPTTGNPPEKAKTVDNAKPAPPQNQMQVVNRFFLSPAVRARFMEILGKQNAGPYIASVLIAVGSSDKLMKCSLPSIFHSAERAATLRLSVDPSTGQAYLVPFAGKCTLIVGYKGLYDMAVRTEKYTLINVHEIYEGQVITPDPFTGEITRESLSGGPTSKKVIGWLGVFIMRSTMSHTLYMTVEEIHAHAKHYSKSYSYPDSGWQTNVDAMERKTVLRLLLRRWGYLDPVDKLALEAAEAAEDEEETIADLQNLGVIDGEWSDPVPVEERPKPSEAELMHNLGYGKKAPGTIEVRTITQEEAQAEMAAKKEEPAKESPIQRSIRTFWELDARAQLLGLPASMLPERVTIDQVRKLINELTSKIVTEEIERSKKAKPTQTGMSL